MPQSLTPDQIESAVRSGVSSALGSKINLSPQASAASGSATGSFFDGGPLASLSGVVRSFANGITGAAQAVGDTVEVWRRASDLGINFGNDAVGLRASIGTTRLSVEEYSQVMEKLRQGMGVFGGTLSQGTKAFNELSYQFGSSNFAENLLKAGFTTKEYNEILALTNAGIRRDYLNNKDAIAQASEAAYKVAIEMDKVAQITGLSRKQQQDAMFERQQDARLQAMFREANINGNTKLQTEYDQIANKFRAFGAPVEGLLRDMFLNGRLSDQSIKTQIALGGENAERMRNAVNNLREATRSNDPKQIEAAQRKFQEVFADIAKTMSDPNTLKKIQLAQGDWADILGKIGLSSRILNDQIAAEKDRVKAKTGEIINDYQAVLNLWSQAGKLQVGQTEAGANAGAKTTEAYVLVQKRLQDAATVISRMMDAGNTAIGKSETAAKAIEALQNVKEAGGADFTARFGANFDNIINKLKDGTATKADVSGLVKNLETQVSDFIKTTGIDLSKTVITEAYQMGKTVAQGFGDGITEIFRNLAKSTAPSAPPRHGGTIGETGKLKEVGSPIVQLKDRETVFTEEQLMNFARNSASTNLNVIGDIVKSLEPVTVPTETPITAYETMFAGIFKDIQAKISPVNIPNTVTFDRESIENLSTKLSSTVESVAGVLSKTEVTPPPVVEPNFDRIIDTVVGEFQKSMPNVTDTFSKGVSELTTIIPKIGQNQARDLIRIIPSEIQQARYESQRQEEARRRTEPQPAEVTTTEQSQNLNINALDEIKEILIQLNTTMGSSVGQLSELVGVTEKQVRATKRLDPNVSVR